MIFDILSMESIKKIVEIQVAQIVKRLTDKQIDLVLSTTVYDYLAKEGYNPQYGARPLRRLIQNKILNPVANLIISQEVSRGGKITVDLKVDKFTFDVSGNGSKRKSRNKESLVVANSLIVQGR
jgi:ATP-dependent Clp protease ATP-binding subunit ClpA